MFSIFKKKTVVPHVRLTGVIGSAGRFRQGMDLAGQKDILKKAFSLKKITHVYISHEHPDHFAPQVFLNYEVVWISLIVVFQYCPILFHDILIL